MKPDYTELILLASQEGVSIHELILRNCVEPSLGIHIFNCAFKEKQEVLR